MNRLSILISLISLAACSESESGPSPPEQCLDLVRDLCDRVGECGFGAGGTLQQCVQDLQPAFPCGNATSVSASYDRCLAQLNSISCSALYPGGDFSPPADCINVIRF